MQRIAMIDIGSNSARLVINRIHSNKYYNMIYSQKETLRLSQKLDENGNLTTEGINATIATLNNFSHMCNLFKVNHKLAVCTAAIRNAQNSNLVLQEIKERTNVPIRVISGEEEAHYTFLGAINSLDIEDGVFFDLGGGSTEIILVRDRAIVFSISIPVGAVNISDKFEGKEKNSDPDAVAKKMFEYVNSLMEEIPWIKDTQLPLVGIGGTARTLAKILQRRKNYNYYKIHNYQFSVEDFNSFYQELRKIPRSQRSKISGLSADRADIILAGVSIIATLFKISNSPTFITSGHGVRDGLFYEYYFNSLNKQIQILPNVLQYSISLTQELSHIDLEHAERINNFAGKMFEALFSLHKLPKQYKKILSIAAQLHDIGMSINFFNHEQHSAYLIESMQLFGLTHFEQIMSAVVACWHNGIMQNYFKYHIYNEILQQQDWQIARKLALFISIAEALDYTEMGAISDISFTFGRGNVILLLVEAADPNKKPVVEISQVRTKANWFRKEFGLELMIGVK